MRFYPRQYTKALSVSVCSFFLIFYSAAELQWEKSPFWLYVLLISVGFSTFIYWIFSCWQDRFQKFFSFGAIVLLGYSVQHIFMLVDWYLQGDVLWQWPPNASSDDPMAALIKSEVISFLGTMLVFTSWFSATRIYYAQTSSSSISTHRVNLRLLGTLYIFSILILLAYKITNFLPEIRLIHIYLELSAAGSAFFIASAKRSIFFKITRVVLMVSPLFLLSLGGMKEAMIISVLPVFMISWMIAKNLTSRFLFLAAALSIVIFAVTFSNHVRHSWDSSHEYSIIDTFGNYILKDYEEDVITRSVKQMIDRVNSSAYQPWAIAIADRDGFAYEMIFGGLSTILIPRLIWADKPHTNTGSEFTAMLYGDQHGHGTTSIGTGLFSGFYLGGGWIAVIMGSLLVGVMVALAHRLAFKIGGLTLSAIFSYSLVPFALKLPEAWPTAALVYPLITLIYLSLIFLFSKVIMSFFSRVIRNY